NFIFGEAQCPGKAAIISLFRLRPEFYGEEPNRQLFMERSISILPGHICPVSDDALKDHNYLGDNIHNSLAKIGS
ncbi:MAG: hypothetical protein QXK42_07610, partial [Candidatus Korarchaeum sp.]